MQYCWLKKDTTRLKTGFENKNFTKISLIPFTKKRRQNIKSLLYTVCLRQEYCTIIVPSHAVKSVKWFMDSLPKVGTSTGEPKVLTSIGSIDFFLPTRSSHKRETVVGQECKG